MKTLCLSLGLCLMPLPVLAACEAGPFEVFFPAFARDIALQEAATAEQVKVFTLDPEAEPEPALTEREVPRAALEWPLVPALTPFTRAGGSVTYATERDGASARLTGDSGYLMTLIFRKDPCWRLTEIRDESM